MVWPTRLPPADSAEFGGEAQPGSGTEPEELSLPSFQNSRASPLPPNFSFNNSSSCSCREKVRWIRYREILWRVAGRGEVASRQEGRWR